MGSKLTMNDFTKRTKPDLTKANPGGARRPPKAPQGRSSSDLLWMLDALGNIYRKFLMNVRIDFAYLRNRMARKTTTPAKLSAKPSAKPPGKRYVRPSAQLSTKPSAEHSANDLPKSVRSCQAQPRSAENCKSAKTWIHKMPSAYRSTTTQKNSTKIGAARTPLGAFRYQA